MFTDVYIGFETRNFLQACLRKHGDVATVNTLLQDICGIQGFFEDQTEISSLGQFLNDQNPEVRDKDRIEYGDFQTNFSLARKIVVELSTQGVAPQVVIEPTFGKGNFILAALQTFENLEHIVGIEIYKPYFWETKFSILEFFLSNPGRSAPTIRFFHQDVFLFDFQQLSKDISEKRVLLLGNPPWVTSAKLGALNSSNLPAKTNFKNLDGLDAMTGKSNFDLGEYITILLLRAFHQSTGWLAFLVKNTVIRNILLEQQSTRFHIGAMRQVRIDAKKEFGAAVEASLFFCRCGVPPQEQCIDSDSGVKFGWVGKQFVSDIESYASFHLFDGKSPFEWRQGLKHDCSIAMELEKSGEGFRNGQGKSVQIEWDLVYGLLKSSDLKGGIAQKTRKFTIVTQRKIGQDTAWIKDFLPQTYAYLEANRQFFEDRKSSIYKNKPPFSIFGIGDYSFLPYKVAISGLYKSATFTLVLPQDDKPVMLDDTCYFLGFETLEEAVICFALLNNTASQGFLSTITFSDAKRRYTKDVLMRLDLVALSEAVPFSGIVSCCAAFPGMYIPSELAYANFLAKLNTSVHSPQLQLF